MLVVCVCVYFTCQPKFLPTRTPPRSQQNDSFPPMPAYTGLLCMLSTILQQWSFHSHRIPIDCTGSLFDMVNHVHTHTMMNCHLQWVFHTADIVPVKIIPLNQFYPAQQRSPMVHYNSDCLDHRILV